MSNGDRYASLFERLVANTHEPENDQACWIWKGRTDGKSRAVRYGRLNVRINGKHTTLQPHRVMFELINGVKLTTEQEVDHWCQCSLCVNPDHLGSEAITKSDNVKLRWSRRA
jgi:hypothetical protein